MRVRDLLEQLEGVDEDAEVLIAHQPAWPLAEVLAGMIHGDDLPSAVNSVDDAGPAVWLVAGGHPDGRSPYAPADVFEAAL